MDDLLARLEIDGSVAARRIVELLFNSYMPVDKPLEVQLTRAVSLVRANHAAARKFYVYAYLHMGVAPTCWFNVSCYLFSVWLNVFFAWVKWDISEYSFAKCRKFCPSPVISALCS